MRDSDRKIIKIGAAKTDRISATGEKIYVESASFPFILALGQGNNNVVKSGCEIDAGERFDSILIINPNTTVALQAVIWVGSARVFFHYPAIPGTAMVPASGEFAGSPTGTPPGQLTGVYGITFPGIATGAVKYSNQGIAEGNRRKQFVVTNRSGVEQIYLSDMDGIIFASVGTQDDYTLETDTDFKVWGTATKPYYVAELFYK